MDEPTEQVNRYALSEIQRKTFTEAFGLVDKDKTGLVPVSEFAALFRSIGQNPSEADLERMAVSFHGAQVSLEYMYFTSLRPLT